MRNTMMPLRVMAVFFFISNVCRGEIRLSLDSDKINGQWTLRNENLGMTLAAKVPGGIYTDLRDDNKLDANLFYRFNDIDYRWVAKENWTYVARFTVPSEILEKRAINLVFHGIDTVAYIFLNGDFIKLVDNMFVRYVIPIETHLKLENTLEVKFKSPIFEAKRLSQSRTYPVPPECTPKSYNGECHVNFLRKMQASFSWDWGPAFPSMGIWKTVEIEAYDLGVVRDITVNPVKLEDFWLVNIAYYVEYADPDPPEHEVSIHVFSENSFLESKDRIIDFNSKLTDVGTKNGYICHDQMVFDAKKINLWWLNGMGESPLYKLKIKIRSTDHVETSIKTVSFGFRTVELIQEFVQPGLPGLSFFFKINGIPFFAKGSNWIPGHILPELGYNETLIRDMLQSVKDANMNMLRVWGGGVYESDTFYQIADELGIFIWQDMMFACSMYPTDQYFIESVKLEIQQQIRRLQHHPSIALWAGNNENEVALRGNWYNTEKNFSLYHQDYVKLYINTIQSVVMANDNSRAFVPSSPSNGLESVKENYVAKDPYSPLYGDVHYYNYFLDGWSPEIYPDTRFASEYGFQSLPSFQSLSRVTNKGDRMVFSEFLNKRQHLPQGNLFLINMIERQLLLPFNDGSEEFLKIFIYYSQISQAMSTKTETEKYRRDRCKLTSDNKGRTMGAMYWQLNDVWEAPSWSSIEFNGKWKMLHYYAKKFFSPVLVSPEKTKNDMINIYLVSDLLMDIPKVILSTYVYSWSSLKPKKAYSTEVILYNNSAAIYSTHKLGDILDDADCNKESCFLYFTAVGPKIFSDNFLFLSKIRDIKNLQKPIIKVTVKSTPSSSEALVKITTDQIAPFVWLETEESGEFSDNGFILLRESVDVIFQNRQGHAIDLDHLNSSITITTLS